MNHNTYMSEPQPLTAVGGKSAHSVMALHDAAEPKSKSNPSVSDMAKVASQPVEGVVGFPIWKRTFDAVLIFLAAPLWLPVCLVVAVVIRLGSRGPLLFKQDRVGQGGKIFTCFKFRTMKLNADQGAHQNHVKDLIKSSAPMVKLDAADDERLTRGGSWIRAMGLDELPQLINVLRGDMSIVGPRPCIPYEYELYEPWQKQRFNAPPGLTGLWQVSGKNRTTFDEMVRLDMAYARRMSVWLDLKIIVLTPVTIVQQVADTWLAKKQMWSKKSSK